MNTVPTIQYTLRDATAPDTSKPAIIAHICNDVGGWGAGFVLAISKRWKAPEAQYRLWSRNALPNAPAFALGETIFVPVEDSITVANMVAQHGIGWQGDVPPIRYEAVKQALGKVAAEARRLSAGVHMPRIGCGLAGGTWDRIEPLIQSELIDQGISVTVYDFAKP